MKYAIYLLATGQIMRVVNCPASQATHQAQEGEGCVEMADGDDSTHYVANDTFAPIPSRPSESHVFDWTNKTWLDPRTLGERKLQKWTTIKQAREAAIDAPLPTPYGMVDSRAKDRTNITDAVLMLQTLNALGTPTTIAFTMADNTTVTLDTMQMVTIGLMLGQKVQAAHATARGLRTAIDSATTVSQLENISWPT